MAADWRLGQSQRARRAKAAAGTEAQQEDTQEHTRARGIASLRSGLS